MEVLYVLIPLALGFVLAMVAVFAWAVRAGQFDDLETPGLRVLFDDGQSPAAPVTTAASVTTAAPAAGRGAPSSSRRVASAEVARAHRTSSKR